MPTPLRISDEWALFYKSLSGGNRRRSHAHRGDGPLHACFSRGASRESMVFTSALPRRPRSLGSRIRAMAQTPAKLYRMMPSVMRPVQRP